MLKKMKLTQKLALVIGLILTISLAILVGMSSLLSQKAITTATYGELNEISESNAEQVQTIFDEAETAAKDMQNYLANAYVKAEANPE